jgi:DNA-binding LacI/PurR family transcriptional regulator
MITLFGHLADELALRNYSILLSKIATHVDGWVEDLFRPGQVDGVILIGQSFEHEAIQAAHAQGVPLVAWGERLAAQRYPTVGSDNHLGGRLAAAHLIQTGRRRIAFLGDERLPEIGARYQGYRSALSAAALAYDAKLHVRTSFQSDSAYAAVKAALMKGAEPDGIVAASDVIALAAIRALAERSLRVPLDVSVVGYDDIALASFSHPALTTVRQDLGRGAELLVEKVIALSEGKPIEPTELMPELVVRESA